MECFCCEGPLERHQLALSPALRIHTVGDSLSGKEEQLLLKLLAKVLQLLQHLPVMTDLTGLWLAVGGRAAVDGGLSQLHQKQHGKQLCQYMLHRTLTLGSVGLAAEAGRLGLGSLHRAGQNVYASLMAAIPFAAIETYRVKLLRQTLNLRREGLKLWTRDRGLELLRLLYRRVRLK
ncbi:MAG: hypothetical protein FRX49_12301 [Trebouxia sp. A1-2]|nr:MAG: hypothetical protein FRX49_12301 [Trebouxia sp. A1-2]